ncbi:MAG: response regulator [Nitrospirae bacterium]|nr:MAG: response regulator [Nitrospirota bacterium]
MSLRLKIFLPLFFFGALLFTYLYGYWMPHSLFYAEEEYRKSTERHIDSVMEGIVPFLLSGQIDTIHENLNTLMHKNKHWLGLQLFDPAGKLIYPLQSSLKPDIGNKPDIYTIEKQIVYFETKLGRLTLTVDYGQRLNVIRSEHNELAFTLLLSTGVFFVCIWFVLERVVSRPIKVIANASKRLADGDFDAPLLKTGQDEIGTLADSFCDMRDAIRGYQTELTRKNESLKEEHEFLLSTIESLSHPFYVIDASSYRIVLANKAAYSGPVIPENLTCYYMTHGRSGPCSGEDHPCCIAEIRKTKKPAVLEHTHLSDKGVKNIFEIYAYPILDEKGAVSRVIEYCIDVTEKRKADEEKEQMAAQLLHLQKLEAIGTLAGGIAHDFNNILMGMMGYCDMARYSVPEGSEIVEMLDNVLKAGKRAKYLVQQILSFSRQTEQMKTPLKIQDSIEEALKLLRASIPTTIEFRKNIDTHCEPVLADPTQMHQIIMNLCTNAYHAMRKTGGVLGVALKKVDIERDGHTTGMILSPGEYLKLEVSDTGHGIEHAVLDRIFEPFFTTKEIGEGTGMGLAVVHGIVKSHGGHITVYSEPGIGTTFNVYLPVLKQAVSAREEDPRNIRPSFESLPGGNERILLVDDEEEIALMGRQILEKLGYSVSSFTKPLDALEALHAKPDSFDLVITDMTMPLMTGLEFAHKILALRKDMPIILCTGFSELINGDRAKVIGIREYVMKPILISEIAATVRRVLDRKDNVSGN